MSSSVGKKPLNETSPPLKTPQYKNINAMLINFFYLYDLSDLEKKWHHLIPAKREAKTYLRLQRTNKVCIGEFNRRPQYFTCLFVLSSKVL
jgi:hypothetical protein